MQNSEKMDDEANVSLKQVYMTPTLIDKIAKETEQSDADAVLMAQDVSQYGMNSLTVESLKEEWYSVKYKFSAGSKVTTIYIKACDCDGDFKIVDIAWIGTDITDNETTQN